MGKPVTLNRGEKNVNVTAIILAGGAGTRMGDACKEVPKSMLTFDDKPFLEYLVEWFIGVGIRDIVLSTGFLGEYIASHFGKDIWKKEGVRVVREEVPLGTGGAIRFASTYANQETLFLCNADTVVEIDLPTTFQASAMIQKPMVSVVTLNEGVPNQGAIKVESGIVTEFREDGSMRPLTKSGGNFRASSTGCYFAKKSLILSEHFRHGSSLEKEILPRLVEDRLVGAVSCGTGIFFEFGIPERHAFLKQNTWILRKVYRAGL